MCFCFLVGETCCVVSSSLPRRAMGVTPWCEALGTMAPRVEPVRLLREEKLTLPDQGGKALGMNGMANGCELL
jgi:hypothetical protein